MTIRATREKAESEVREERRSGETENPRSDDAVYSNQGVQADEVRTVAAVLRAEWAES